ncbi:MAG: hypothetical protein Q7I99_07680 [Acholeplasmataceae bacterium]|nr:hypothetical protein [Acholeplasmataceae bacterium]
MVKQYIPIGIIIMLIIALGFTSTAAFAYWQDVSSIGNVVIRFEGEDANLIIEETSDSFTGMLVPEGRVYFEGEVDQVTFTYDVSIDKTLVQSMNLLVEAIDVKIGDSTTYAHLVDIQIATGGDSFEYELFNSTVTVQLVVRLIEPIDPNEAAERGLGLEMVNVGDGEAAFNSIKGATISFVVSFKVVPRDLN